MSLTYDQFSKYALDLKNHSDSIDDDWNFCEYQNPMNGNFVRYLVKKKMQKLNFSSEHSEFDIEKYSTPVMCEYDILYNSSYSCPDMYFNMWYTDGKLLSLENIWSVVHSCFKQNLVLDKWNALTQDEHPYNRTPYFRVHPCKSTHILKILGFSSRNTTELNPIITWLSTISPLIGLELNLSYGHKN